MRAVRAARAASAQGTELCIRVSAVGSIWLRARVAESVVGWSFWALCELNLEPGSNAVTSREL